MGLTIFAVLMTLWLARPVKYTSPLKWVLVSIMGYGIGGTAGIIQANYAVNRYFHNTQWIVGIHAHVQLLIGLGGTVFAAIYALFPCSRESSSTNTYPTPNSFCGRLADS